MRHLLILLLTSASSIALSDEVSFEKWWNSLDCSEGAYHDEEASEAFQGTSNLSDLPDFEIPATSAFEEYQYAKLVAKFKDQFIVFVTPTLEEFEDGNIPYEEGTYYDAVQACYDDPRESKLISTGSNASFNIGAQPMCGNGGITDDDIDFEVFDIGTSLYIRIGVNAPAGYSTYLIRLSNGTFVRTGQPHHGC